MVMHIKNPSLMIFLFLQLIMVSSISYRSSIVDARPLSFKSHLGNSGFFASLGIVCKCCDGKEGACTSTWEGRSCSNLQCSPWKYQYHST